MSRGVAIAIALLVVGEAWGQPQPEAAFGFTRGMALAEARSLAPLSPVPSSPHHYTTTRPAKPVAPFATYLIVAPPVSGLCMVVAQTEPRREGSSLQRREAAAVLGMLRRRYGPPSSQTDDATTWVGAQGPGTSVTMALSSDDDQRRRVAVEYRFSNVERCQREIADGV